MKRRLLFAGVMVLAVVVVLAGGADVGRAEDEDRGRPRACRVPLDGQTTEIAAAKLYIEYNATDDDVGVHGAFDGEGWSELCVLDPDGRPMLAVKPEGALRDLTMAGIFFESREPPISEFSIADLKAAFPEGGYEVRGKSFDGTILTGSADFTHDIPAPPTITAPQLAEEPEQTDGAVLSRTAPVVSWEPVTETIESEPVTTTGYEVIITKEVDDDPHGFSRPTFDVHVPPSVNSLTVSPEFLEPSTVYELEVLALEVSGNQTISVGFFETD
jgi:hypothetical protein